MSSVTFAPSKPTRETIASGRGKPSAVRFTGLRIGHRDGAAEGDGRADPAGTTITESNWKFTYCVGRAYIGDGFLENMGRWLGQITAVDAHHATIGSQHPASGLTAGSVSKDPDGFGDTLGLQISMPNRHLNFIGSQQSISVEGIGRIVGFAENDALILNTRCVGFGVIDSDGLHRGASEGQSNSFGSQQSALWKEGIGVIVPEGLQMGANCGHVLS